jgi:hypothetical protein
MKIIKISLFILTSFLSIHAQSLSGLSGLFNIPTAETADDGEMIIGVNFLERNHLKYAGGKRDVISPFITVGFLPFLELSVRITRQLNANYTSHVMDRMFSAKVKFINESEFFPSLTFGLQNPYSTLEDANHFNSTYLVLSKNIFINTIINRVHLIVGFGSDIIKAADHQFVGLFGGASITLLNFSELMIEHDAERFNAGIRLIFFNQIKLLAGLMDLKYLSGGISVGFKL